MKEIRNTGRRKEDYHKEKAIEVLRSALLEWDVDLESIQCFDLGIVKRAREIIRLIDEVGSVDCFITCNDRTVIVA